MIKYMVPSQAPYREPIMMVALTFYIVPCHTEFRNSALFCPTINRTQNRQSAFQALIFPACLLIFSYMLKHGFKVFQGKCMSLCFLLSINGHLLWLQKIVFGFLQRLYSKEIRFYYMILIFYWRVHGFNMLFSNISFWHFT